MLQYRYKTIFVLTITLGMDECYTNCQKILFLNHCKRLFFRNLASPGNYSSKIVLT